MTCRSRDYPDDVTIVTSQVKSGQKTDKIGVSMYGESPCSFIDTMQTNDVILNTTQ